ncbi:hypothetical protein NPIL_687361 [Nephila pilipes]|uniref:Uncharacterized protein n=1 Tax=Nephila pilipes TaxID=299642 RepID=A0A8X6Q8T2_NEPPI|nr:hypothetical protein NPIL_687361 [Nephila pilipes]
MGFWFPLSKPQWNYKYDDILNELLALHPFGYLRHLGYHHGPTLLWWLLQHSPRRVSLCLQLRRCSPLLRMEMNSANR